VSRQTTFTEYAGDDFEKLGELRRKIDLAQKRAMLTEQRAQLGTEDPREGDDELTEVEQAVAEVEQAVADYEEFVEAAAARGTEWVLHAIGHQEFRDLLKAHPPRTITEGEGEEATEVIDPEDIVWGFNTETFGTALLLWRDPEDDRPGSFDPADPPHRTVISPALEPAALERRIKRLSAGEFRTMWAIAEALNSGRMSDPKALLNS
jgi:hypothetical protein